jgi:dinuclear metal center YbgI/SA1388 family protein
MSNTVAEVASTIAASVQLDKAAEWDPVGLQLGDPRVSVERVAVCHEVTPELVRRVIEANVDMLVSYHPLLFRPVAKLVSGPGPAGRAFDLIANGVALVVVHTAFDVMAGGSADALAAALDLTDITGFGPAWGRDAVKIVTFAPQAAADGVASAMANAGAGAIGSYSNCSFRSEGIGVFHPAASAAPHVGVTDSLNYEPEIRIEMIAPESDADSVVAALVRAHPYEEPAYDVIPTRSNAGFIGRQGALEEPMSVAMFADRVSDRLGGTVRVAGSGMVRNVAVVPGSGGSFLGQANADVVVTGDVNHHQARAATAMGVAVIDPGHAATERPGVQALYALIAKSINAIDMTDIDQDPWKER